MGVLLAKQPTQSAETGDAAIESVSFRIDNNQIVAASKEGGVVIHDTSTWLRCSGSGLPGRESGIIHALFAPNFGWLAVSCQAGASIYKERPPSLLGSQWEKVADLENSSHFSTSMAFAGSSNLIAVGAFSGKVVIYDVPSGRELQVLMVEKSGWICAVEFSSDGNHMAVGCSTGKLALYDIRGWEQELCFEAAGRDIWVLSAAFSFDSTLLAVGCQKGKLLIYGKPSTMSLARLWGSWSQWTDEDFGSHAWVKSVSFSADGNWFGVGCLYPGCLVVYQVQTWQQVLRFSQNTSFLHFSPDGQWLATGGSDGRLALYESRTWREVVVLCEAKSSVVIKNEPGSPWSNPVTQYCRASIDEQSDMHTELSGRLRSSDLHQNWGTHAPSTSGRSRSQTTEASTMQGSMRNLEDHFAKVASSIAASLRADPGKELERCGVPSIPFALLEDMCEGFYLKNQIGRGAFGVVYQGCMKGSTGDVQIAVKRWCQGSGSSTKPDLQREASVMAMCRHENIVPLIAISSDKDFCIVMPFMPDGSLEHLLQDRNRLRTCGAGQRMGYARDIFHGLSYLHASSWSKPSIVHCDLKPENMFLQGSVARIGDVGVAKFVTFWQRGVALPGTQCFTDPKVGTNGQLTTASDVYSAGIILLMLLTGSSTIAVEESYSLAQSAQERWEARLRRKESSLISDYSIDWPGTAARSMHALAVECLNLEAKHRPSSNSVQERLQELLDVGPAGPPTQEQVAESGARVCVICLSAPRQGFLHPCGHYVACWVCSELIVAQGQRCPICRGLVLRFTAGHSTQTYVGEGESDNTREAPG